MNNILNICTSLSLFVSFIITLLFSKHLIPVLIKFKYGQSILKIGPSWHQKKQGTPTMGGISMIIGVIFSSIICSFVYYFVSCTVGIQNTETNLVIIKNLAGLFMAFIFGIIGFIDDFVKIKNKSNLGITAKQKLILQFSNAAVYLGIIYASQIIYSGKADTTIIMPLIGRIDFGLFYYIFSLFIIVGIVNAVNLTDGIDGLCASVSFVNAIGFMLISRILKMQNLAIQSSSMAGSCLGFLFWNFHPAKIFMGDTGSLFLGGLICAIGFGTNNIFLLIIISFVYILEMFSVMLQVVYFKVTNGKRIFKMSPIHHHFELIGFKETKICLLFTAISCFFVLIAIVFLIFNFI